MPDISMCVQRCPKAPNCYRHPLSGTLPSGLRQAYMNYKPADCRSYVPRNNEEMNMDTALWNFLVSIEAQRHVPTRRKGDWEAAYNETAQGLAQQLRQIAQLEGADHELVVALNEVAEFYEQPVEDPEMGTFDMGVSAAMQAFGVAVVSVMQERRADERWDLLLKDFVAD
ncbi:hypothetical protein HNR26_002341 [Rhizobium rosettiformans]|uniref:Uncharacterized protein n=2 Tax=Rhizobium rosettiformans TaxID=1368430 RepID=A0A4S8PZ31_9HYPH|nr:hypothetical protein [Rhizobium rosettiformans]MBB5276289.1 hypothetical protein [Rhizobium rosettiformans]THV36920.1 hypothetical protein FAA86_10520 [Rhizobium rosettiformans W3]